MSKSIVIFSGGQDSTVCLAWAKRRFGEVTAVTYNYGQKHLVEIEQAQKIAAALDIPHHIFDISFYADLVNSALTGAGNLDNGHQDAPGLPASFVPNRNGLFILLAHSFAQKIKADALVAGVCQADYSGYPDCREEFIRAMEKALNLGAEQNIKLLAPLMFLTKAETFQLAKEEGALDLVINESHTCYRGDAEMNEWGRGCGNCPACRLRAKGFEEFKNIHGE